ncbi:MAG: AMIN domain-containing protein [Myxococcota bacterium]
MIFRRAGLRRLWIGAALGVLLLVAPAASNSAGLLQVRVGKHPTFTRVVFELDEETAYRVQPQEDPDELVVDLAAGSHRRVMSSRSDLVASVRVTPEAGGAVAHIQLRGGPVHVTEIVLENPPRIVLDLRPLQPRLTGTPALEPDPPVATTEPSGAEPTTSTPEPDGVDLAGLEPEPDTAPPPLPFAGGPDVSAGGTPAPVPDAEPAPDPAPPGDLAGTEPDAPVTPADADRVPSGSESSAGEPVLATRPDPVPLPGGEPPSDQGDASAGDAPLIAQLPEALRDRRVLVALGGAALVAALLIAWSRTRRRDRRRGLFAPLSEIPELEPVVEAQEDLGAGGFPSAQEAEPSLFGTRPEMEEPEDDAKPEPELAEGVTPPAFPLGAAASGASDPVLGQRLAELERRVEEVLDAKDRLERHVAAQTEELRVQRAAIARTQRVLRNLTRPDDAATEPALKERPQG